MRVEAPTLQDAISQAAQNLDCSVIDVEIEIIQKPSSGFLGFFKKNAIIEAGKSSQKRENFGNSQDLTTMRQDEVADKICEFDGVNKFQTKKSHNQLNFNRQKQGNDGESVAHSSQFSQQKNQNHSRENEGYYHKKTPNFDEILPQIQNGVELLFKSSCFEIDKFEVTKYDNKTIFIKIDGADAALVIGRDGCRYKAFSYLLFNWINLKFGLLVRFEVGQFLKNQESMMSAYLKDIIERVEADGKGFTKPLDGVLIKIALEQLRAKFPKKYVGVKSGKNGKFVVVNDFK